MQRQPSLSIADCPHGRQRRLYPRRRSGRIGRPSRARAGARTISVAAGPSRGTSPPASSAANTDASPGAFERGVAASAPNGAPPSGESSEAGRPRPSRGWPDGSGLNPPRLNSWEPKRGKAEGPGYRRRALHTTPLPRTSRSPFSRRPPLGGDDVAEGESHRREETSPARFDLGPARPGRTGPKGCK